MWLPAAPPFSIANHLQLAAKKSPASGGARIKLLHQQHLTRALDGAVQAALIMRREASVLTRQDAALVGHELTQQIRVLEIERVHREVNLRLRTGRAFLGGTATTAVRFIGIGLARHKWLLDFAV